jgi:hypothetical protein
VSAADLEAWLQGREPPPASQTEAEPASQLLTIKLFSLNDYLGLSNHPDVRRAAAEASMQVGCAAGRGARAASWCGSSEPDGGPCLSAAAGHGPAQLGAGGRLQHAAQAAGAGAGAAQGHAGLPALPHG